MLDFLRRIPPQELARELCQLLVQVIAQDPEKLSALARAFGCAPEEVPSHPHLAIVTEKVEKFMLTLMQGADEEIKGAAAKVAQVHDVHGISPAWLLDAYWVLEDRAHSRHAPAGFFSSLRAFVREVVRLREETVIKERQEAHSLEQYWQEIFEATGEAMVVYEGERRIEVNPAWEKLLGFSRTEGLSPDFSFSRIMDKDSEDILRQALERAQKGEKAEVEHILRAKDDRYIPVRSTLQKLSGSGKEGEARVVLVVSDLTPFKEKERALAESEAYWREIFEGITEGVVIFDTSARLHEVNGTFAAMVDHEKEELLASDAGWKNFVPPDLIEENLLHNQIALEGTAVRYETSLLKRDGTRVPVLISYRKLRRRPEWESDRLVCTLSDLSNLASLKEKERELADAERYWREIFEAAGEAMAVVEGERHIEVNRAWESALGYSRAEALSPSFSLGRMMGTHALEIFKASLDKAKRGEQAEFECEFHAKDGRVFPAHVSLQRLSEKGEGKGGRVIVVCSDLTEIKEKEEALVQSEGFWRGVFQAAGEAIAVLEGNRHLEVNRAWESALGYSRAEALSPSFSLGRMMGTHALEIFKASLDKAKRGEQAEFECEFHAKDGRVFPAHVSLQRLSEKGEGKGGRVIVVCSDLTEIKEKERALADAERYWREIFEGAGEGIVVAREEDESVMVVEANAAFRALLDYSLEAIKTPGFISRVTPKDFIEKEKAFFLEAKTAKKPIRYEKPHIRRNGSLVPTIVTLQRLSRPGWLVATFGDISALHERQAEVAAVSALGQKLLLNLAQGKLLFSTEEVFGAAKEVQRLYNQAVEGLSSLIASVRENLEGTLRMVQELTSSQGDFSHRTETAASNLEEVSASLEQLSTSVSSTAHNAGEAAGFMGSVRQRAGQSFEAMSGVGAMVQAMAEDARKTQKIATAIQEIADRTDLLSLNAAIEAAKAGEKGTGFGVLAREIRLLAERTTKEAGEATDILMGLFEGTQAARKECEKSTTLINTLDSDVQEAADRVSQIADAVKEQDEACRQISHAIEELSAHVEETASMGEEITSISEDLSKKSKEVEKSIESFALEAAMPSAGGKKLFDEARVH